MDIYPQEKNKRPEGLEPSICSSAGNRFSRLATDACDLLRHLVHLYNFLVFMLKISLELLNYTRLTKYPDPPTIFIFSCSGLIPEA